MATHKRIIWIEAQSDGQKVWQFEVIGDGTLDDPHAAPPHVEGHLRIRVDERSMGRTDLGLWSSWRSSTWAISVVRDRENDWQTWTDRIDLHDSVFQHALDDFMRASIIPSSAALEIWNDVPVQSVDFSDGIWWAHQRRMSWVKFAITLLTCAGVGIAVAVVLLPVRQLEK